MEWFGWMVAAAGVLAQFGILVALVAFLFEGRGKERR